MNEIEGPLPDYLKPQDPIKFGKVIIHAPTAAEVMAAQALEPAEGERLVQAARSYLNHPVHGTGKVVIHAPQASELMSAGEPSPETAAPPTE